MRGDKLMEYCYLEPKDDELMHYGVKGMHWGVRRYQNDDGTLTDAGKAHYGGQIRKIRVKNTKLESKYTKTHNKASKYFLKSAKAESKGKSEKYMKYKMKSAKLESDASKINVKISKNKQKIQKISKKLDDIKKKKMKDLQDNMQKGEKIVKKHRGLSDFLSRASEYAKGFDSDMDGLANNLDRFGNKLSDRISSLPGHVNTFKNRANYEINKRVIKDYVSPARKREDEAFSNYQHAKEQQKMSQDFTKQLIKSTIKTKNPSVNNRQNINDLKDTRRRIHAEKQRDVDKTHDEWLKSLDDSYKERRKWW